MRYCIYIAALLALVNCEPNRNPSFRNRDKNMYLRNKPNVFKPQQNRRTLSRDDSHKIFGGKFVMDIEEYPFIALLRREYYWKGKRSSYGICGATILNKKYLLSAAHCFQSLEPNYERYPAKEYTAHVGGLSINRSLDHANVKQYFSHPQYECYKADGEIKANFDIAVIELEKELHFSRKVSSVKIPPQLTTSGLTSRLPKRCILIGTGSTSLNFQFNTEIYLLKVAEVEVVNPNNATRPKCKEITKICDTDQTHNENSSCYGDSGGPLICDGVQVGIVSYGNVACTPNDEEINTRVEYYVDWINAFIKGN